MIFQHTIDKVLSGEKTQTRRIVVQPTIEYQRDGDWLFDNYGMGPISVNSAKPCPMGKGLMGLNYKPAFVKWQVGKTYAAQPGRGQKAVGRIEIVSIRREDVRKISDADVIAEGFEWRSEFLKTWAAMHDKSFYDMVHRYEDRPVERYQAWVLEFRLVKAS